MEIIITIGIVVIAITCLSIDAKLRESCKRDKEIVLLLKKIAQKK